MWDVEGRWDADAQRGGRPFAIGRGQASLFPAAKGARPRWGMGHVARAAGPAPFRPERISVVAVLRAPVGGPGAVHAGGAGDGTGRGRDGAARRAVGCHAAGTTSPPDFAGKLRATRHAPTTAAKWTSSLVSFAKDFVYVPSRNTSYPYVGQVIALRT